MRLKETLKAFQEIAAWKVCSPQNPGKAYRLQSGASSEVPSHQNNAARSVAWVPELRSSSGKEHLPRGSQSAKRSIIINLV